MLHFPPQQRFDMLCLVLIEIGAVHAEQRRGRHNPRVVKRKISNFPIKARTVQPAPCLPPTGNPIAIIAPIPPPQHKPDTDTTQGIQSSDQSMSDEKILWRGHIRSWLLGKLSRRGYCKQNALNLGMFNAWAKRLRNTFKKS